MIIFKYSLIFIQKTKYAYTDFIKYHRMISSNGLVFVIMYIRYILYLVKCVLKHSTFYERLKIINFDPFFSITIIDNNFWNWSLDV
jgi:hypothetical protein